MKRLYPHQQQEVLDHWNTPSRALFWCPRAGKTLAALWVARRQMEAVECHTTCTVVSTPPGVTRHWEEEARQIGATTFRWDSEVSDSELRRRVVDTLKSPLPVLIFGSHTWALPRAQWVFAHIIKSHHNCLLIADESHEYASPSSKRGRRIRAFARKTSVSQRLLTGTPIHNRLLDAWGQFEIFTSGALGFQRYQDFANYHGIWRRQYGPYGTYPKLIGYSGTDILNRRMMKYSSVIRAEDLPDMQPVSRRLVRAPLLQETRKTYRKMLNELSEENAATTLMRMQQLVSSDPLRRAQTISRVRMAGDNAVVWVRHNADIAPLADELLCQSVPVFTYFGQTPQAAREEVHKRMHHGGEGGVLIAQPAACGVGVDLSAVTAMIWHAPPVDARTAAQALERCTRKGGGTVRADYIVSSGIDLRNLERVLRNAEAATSTLSEDIMAVQEHGDLHLASLSSIPACIRKALGR